MLCRVRPTCSIVGLLPRIRSAPRSVHRVRGTGPVACGGVERVSRAGLFYLHPRCTRARRCSGHPSRPASRTRSGRSKSRLDGLRLASVQRSSAPRLLHRRVCAFCGDEEHRHTRSARGARFPCSVVPRRARTRRGSSFGGEGREERKRRATSRREHAAAPAPSLEATEDGTGTTLGWDRMVARPSILHRDRRLNIVPTLVLSVTPPCGTRQRGGCALLASSPSQLVSHPPSTTHLLYTHHNTFSRTRHLPDAQNGVLCGGSGGRGGTLGRADRPRRMQLDHHHPFSCAARTVPFDVSTAPPSVAMLDGFLLLLILQATCANGYGRRAPRGPAFLLRSSSLHGDEDRRPLRAPMRLQRLGPRSRMDG
ncbi:hypothetical protein B0H17DRAFT_332912 [Mycena rosella]|uniref:Uncharacterized protein n=1 Tax=Mycena rosella TaxID=1033263 RepID=A0AAD7DSU5_MYCRO|nr:hypothetical protein B0H17DRAFT_332912 [Mycena rosella]